MLVESWLTNSISDGMIREDDDNTLDNVICRTPARNAQSLELVKSEILEMVDRVVSNLKPQYCEEQLANKF